MTLTITLDADTETAHILVDDHLQLRAQVVSEGQVRLTNFDALLDDELHAALKEVAHTLLRLTSS